MSDSWYLIFRVKISYSLWFSYNSKSLPDNQISDIYFLYEFGRVSEGEGEVRRGVDEHYFGQHPHTLPQSYIPSKYLISAYVIQVPIYRCPWVFYIRVSHPLLRVFEFNHKVDIWYLFIWGQFWSIEVRKKLVSTTESRYHQPAISLELVTVWDLPRPRVEDFT